MSIILANVTPEIAIVAADSGAFAPEHGHLFAGKMFALPHAGAIIAGRGSQSFLANIARDASQAANVDELAQMMPAQLAVLCHVLDGPLRQAGYPLDPAEQGLILVGYSPQRRRIIGTYFEQVQEGSGFTATDVDGEFAAPWDLPTMGDLPVLNGPVAIMSAMLAAKQHGRALHPHFSAGGAVIRAAITREGITTDRVGDLGRVGPSIWARAAAERAPASV